MRVERDQVDLASKLLRESGQSVRIVDGVVHSLQQQVLQGDAHALGPLEVVQRAENLDERVFRVDRHEPRAHLLEQLRVPDRCNEHTTALRRSSIRLTPASLILTVRENGVSPI